MDIEKDNSETLVDLAAEQKKEAETYVLRPRRRWVRRILLSMILIGGMLFGGHWYWGYCQEEGLAEDVRELREMNEPMWGGDFKGRHVDEDQNSAPLLRGAAAAVDDECSTWNQCTSWRMKLPLSKREMRTAQAIIERNRSALSLLAEARRKKGAEWKNLLSATMSDLPSAGLLQQKTLAELVDMNLLVSFEKGDQRGALEAVADLLRISTALEEFVPGYSHGAAAGVSETACSRVIELAPRLLIGLSESEVNRDEVLKVIRMLCDETALVQGHSWRMKWFRANHVDDVRVVHARCGLFSSYYSNSLPLRLGVWAGKPSAMGGAREILKYGSVVLKVADESEDWPAFRSGAADVLGKLREVDQNLGWGSLAGRSSPSYEPFMKYHFQSLGDRRLAATALAMRLYAVEHEGKLPANIEALTPDYLERVPADPFARKGKRLGYVADAKRPVIYSIGENGRDDGGSDRPKDPTTDYPRWRMEDAVVDLTVRENKKVIEDEREERYGVTYY